jgi:hypothetical protein
VSDATRWLNLSKPLAVWKAKQNDICVKTLSNFKEIFLLSFILVTADGKLKQG